MGCGSSSDGSGGFSSPSNGGSSSTMSPAKTTTAPNVIHKPEGVRYYPMSMVRVHTSQKSLWCVIEKKVYDITPFLLQHPGGADLLMMYCCGADATAEFMEEHGTNRSALKELKKYLIGHIVPEGDPKIGSIVPEETPTPAPVEKNDKSATKMNSSVGAAYKASSSFDSKATSGSLINVLQSFSLEEVAKHNTKDDCWTVRKGRVYDLGKYFQMQQRDPALNLPNLDVKRVAGQDATSYFDSLNIKGPQIFAMALENAQIGFLTGHSLPDAGIDSSRRRHSSSQVQPAPANMTSENAMAALHAIATDDLTLAAAEGLIASPSSVRYLWSLVERQIMSESYATTVLLTFEPILDTPSIERFQRTFDSDEIELQTTFPVTYSRERLQIRPGQHVSVEIPKHLPRENPEEHASRERENRPLDVPFRMQRSYTPIDTWKRPDENPTGQMQMLVKLYPGRAATDSTPEVPPGAGSTYMHSLVPGDIITTTSARGVFDFEQAYDTYDTYILLGAGTGLTPLYPVIRELIRRITATAAATPKSPTDSSETTPTTPIPTKQIVLVCQNHSESDLLLQNELDELAESHRDILQISYVLSSPMFSPRPSSFTGQITMDILRFVVPVHLQPSALQIPMTAGEGGSTGSRPRSASGGVPASSPLGPSHPALIHAASIGSSRSASRPASRPRSPSRFTFGIKGDRRADSPAAVSPGLMPMNSDLFHVPDGLKTLESDALLRTRAAVALAASSSRGHSRRPSGDGGSIGFPPSGLVKDARKALCLVCGPPGFNQTVMAFMYKLGFKRGLGNSNGKDLFVF